MPTPSRIERTYRVRFDEAGAGGHLRSSGYLRYAQDLAWIHSESAGFGRDWYAQRGLTWLVRSIELDITDDVEYGADVTVSTEVVGFRRVWARRRSEFAVAARNGAGLVAVALTDWVLLNRRGVPVRPPDEILSAFPTPAAGYTPLRLQASASDHDGSAATPLAPRFTDLDPMGHVNNAVYVDYFEEHLVAVGRRADVRHRPRRYRAEFIDAAEAGTELLGEGWEADAGYEFRLRRAEQPKDLFRARLETHPALWVGG